MYIKLNEDLTERFIKCKEISNYEGEDLPNSFLCIEVKSAKEERHCCISKTSLLKGMSMRKYNKGQL